MLKLSVKWKNKSLISRTRQWKDKLSGAQRRHNCEGVTHAFAGAAQHEARKGPKGTKGKQSQTPTHVWARWEVLACVTVTNQPPDDSVLSMVYYISRRIRTRVRRRASVGLQVLTLKCSRQTENSKTETPSPSKPPCSSLE